MDTIFALSTAQGKAGVSIIRVSGDLAFNAARILCDDVPSPRKASLRVLKDHSGALIDEALVLTFEKNHSFTGEPSVEFQTHGSIAIVNAVLSELSAIDGVRPADPGEFTRRALENNRLDLAQVEGLADLIDSETEAQRKQALRVFSGELGKKTEDWRQKLIRAAALLEATIDFADEDVPVDVSPEVSELLQSVISDIHVELAGVRTAERIRNGFEVAIVGAPNVGKSTLLNAIAGREAAITSEYAGTTRDVIEVRMDLNGLPVTFLDTAGLRETDDHVEGIGINRAKERAEHADLRVFLSEDGQSSEIKLDEDDLLVRAKADLGTFDGLSVSGKSGQGIVELISKITNILSLRASNAGLATRVRHEDSLKYGVRGLETAIALVAAGGENTELIAEEIRTAVRALDSLVGRVDVENLLDEIFASFCLGK